MAGEDERATRGSRAARNRKARLLVLALTALLPNALKRLVYRFVFGYRIAGNVRIGISFIEACDCEIAEGTVIGHGNVIIGVERLRIGDHVQIGHLNILRGGRIDIGRYASIFRLNEINSIPDPVAVGPVEQCLTLGAGSVITAGHKIDFTDRVDIGRRTILGGRNSSLWTHNRQRTAPIVIGDMTYVGSEVRVGPGASIPSRAIVGMGSVVVDALDEHEGHLIVGMPARPERPLEANDLFLVERKTREDMPEDL